MKDQRWKQANAADQFTVIRASLEGHLDNWRDGLITAETFQERCLNHLAQLAQLDPFLHGEQW